MVAAVILLLCGIALLLYIKLHLLLKCLSEINVVLDDILFHSTGRMCHIRSNSKTLQALGQRINALTLKYRNMAEKSKRDEKMIKQFISDISHDIRTPLTSILGYIDVLNSGQALTEEDKNRYIGIIALKGDKLHKYIDDLFEYVKLEVDNTVVRLTRQNLSELVKKMICFMYHDMMEKGLSAVIEIPETDLFVYGEETSINRILQNLLSNVLRYGKTGGYFGITLREEPEKVWVDVWNQVDGIDQNEIKDIFSRRNILRDQSRGGSGFGLAIAKRLVHRMDGEIGVHSIPNERITFSFFLKKYI